MVLEENNRLVSVILVNCKTRENVVLEIFKEIKEDENTH